MITDESKTRLIEIYKAVQRAPKVGFDDLKAQVLLGSLEAAFHLGQVQAGTEIMGSIVNLGEAKASPFGDRAGDRWATGYLEAGNDLMELFAAKFDDLKARIAGASSLTELTSLAGPDVDD